MFLVLRRTCRKDFSFLLRIVAAASSTCAPQIASNGVTMLFGRLVFLVPFSRDRQMMVCDSPKHTV